MTDRPIIFSGPMVRALLDGRKTQTRRVIKPQPVQNEAGLWVHPPKWAAKAVKKWGGACQADNENLRIHLARKGLPYAPGDRLYVREAIDKASDRDGVFYRADYDADYPGGSDGLGWRPSIHMPRWASRLTLTVTEVRVQRLQEISADDVMAEGCPVPFEEYGPGDPGSWFGAGQWFEDHWNSIHGPDAWNANPWVVAVSFTVRNGNIDAVRS